MRKENEKRFNSDGDELIYIGNGLWVPVDVLKSKEEAEKFNERYKRPDIYLFSIIKSIFLPIICLIVFDILLKFWLCTTIIFLNILFIDLCLMGFYIFIHLGDIAIFCIHLYQRYASMDVRGKCSMTPTCSTYCIIAIRKYGLIIGLIKTWKRLRHRCNGDEITDYP